MFALNYDESPHVQHACTEKLEQRPQSVVNLCIQKKQKLSLNVGVLILLQLDFSEREAHVKTATVVAGCDFQSHGLEG